MKPFRNPYKYQGGWAWLAAAAPIIGAAVDWISGDRAASKQRKHTRGVAHDEAYGSVAGRVEAAKASGLHPLAALGTPSSSGANMGGGLSDFTSAASQAVNNYTQQRQWKAEREMQQAQIADNRNLQQRAEMREQARLNLEAARQNKEMEFLDEQIKASQEQRLREAQRSQISALSGVDGPYSSSGPLVKYVPNEVVRNVDGTAQGDNPHVEYMIDPTTGRRIPLPFGMTQNAEPGEAASFLKFASAHYQIPMDVLTGARLLDILRNLYNDRTVVPGESIWDRTKRRIHQARYPNIE